MKKLLLIAIVSILSFAASAADTTTLNLTVGGGYKSAQITVKDNVTGNVLPATVSNVTIQNTNANAATIVSGTSNPALISATGVNPGTGYATVTCTASYVDPGDGLQKTEQKSIVIAYTVVGTPHGAKLSLTFN